MTSMIHIQAELRGIVEDLPAAPTKSSREPLKTVPREPVSTDVDSAVWNATVQALLAFKARGPDECPACFELGLSGQHDRACPIRSKKAA
ncbi:hypothetical protein [Streptomyces sp. NPDC057686]|uniref:hypothetical protein n=1 Tax=Streptomyces sp. NPDC057686 TaxID=3346212 RepID=UPI00368EF011